MKSFQVKKRDEQDFQLKLPARFFGKVDELIDVLDVDIRCLQESLSYLDELRRFVVNRDEASLEKLMKHIGESMDGCSSNALQRQSLRRLLAGALGCSIKELTLSYLERFLEGAKKRRISERKAELKILIDKLKKEHISTTMLLSDCASFNSHLLQGILNLGRKDTVTYTSGGLKQYQSETSFVNMKF